MPFPEFTVEPIGPAKLSFKFTVELFDNKWFVLRHDGFYNTLIDTFETVDEALAAVAEDKQ